MLRLFRLPQAPALFTGMALAGLGIFILAVGVVMQQPAAVLGERTAELVCLQLAFTPERASELVLSFPQEGREAISQILIPGDFMLAWGYGLVLAGLIGLLSMRLPANWMRAGGIVMWVPLLASTLDCVENVFLYAISTQLAADPGIPVAPMLPLFAGIAALGKWVALSVVTPAFGLAGIVKGISVDRRARSWVLYALLAQALISMLLKPIQDIPACF